MKILLDVFDQPTLLEARRHQLISRWRRLIGRNPASFTFGMPF